MPSQTQIFVDTGAWLALFYARDQHHVAAKNWFDQNKTPLVSSNYVVVETLNLVKSRVGQGLAENLSKLFWSEQAADLIWVTQAENAEAQQVFIKYGDKGWSFTDCSSFALMKQSNISVAFAFDHHFEQFPGCIRVP